MTSIGMPASFGRMFGLPTRAELRAMLSRTPVMITAIVCALLAFVFLFGGVFWLIHDGKSVEPIAFLLGGSLITLIVNLRGKINELHTEVKQQQQSSP